MLLTLNHKYYFINDIGALSVNWLEWWTYDGISGRNRKIMWKQESIF